MVIIADTTQTGIYSGFIATKIQMITKGYFQNLYSRTSENLEEMDVFRHI
jgi:hypothetical protein